jgi:molybdopterin/thiamine biosynthesis adenylyltransferase
MLDADSDDYERVFDRNYGVFTKEQQSKLRSSKILIVGCGGVGGTSAIQLARSGIENITLVDPDKYELSNENRQVDCYNDTLDDYKVDVIKDEILRINSNINVVTYNKKFNLDEIKNVIKENDVILAAADDLAYSSHLLTISQNLGKSAITALPYGFGGWISVFTPDSPTIFDVSGTPHVPYKELKAIEDNKWYKTCAFYSWYISQGRWRASWYRSFTEGEKHLAQICPTVWLVSSLACLEMLKLITGKGKVVIAPRRWEIKGANPSIRLTRFSLLRKYWWKLAYSITSIQWYDLGKRLHKPGVSFYLWLLSRYEKNEKNE